MLSLLRESCVPHSGERHSQNAESDQTPEPTTIKVDHYFPPFRDWDGRRPAAPTGAEPGGSAVHLPSLCRIGPAESADEPRALTGRPQCGRRNRSAGALRRSRSAARPMHVRPSDGQLWASLSVPSWPSSPSTGGAVNLPPREDAQVRPLLPTRTKRLHQLSAPDSPLLNERSGRHAGGDCNRRRPVVADQRCVGAAVPARSGVDLSVASSVDYLV